MTYNYPDLGEAIDSLKLRLNNVDGKYEVLLTKWIERLEKTQKEMRHLERIEQFSFALKEQQQEIDNTHE